MIEDAVRPIRVAIVDAHPLVRESVANLLATDPNMALAGGADTVVQALVLLDQTPIDVLLLDLNLPDGTGMEICRYITKRRLPIAPVVLTSLGDEMQLFQALEAGAAGYLLKTARGRTMLEAIRALARHGDLLDAIRARRALAAAAQYRLTAGEREILTYIAEGRTHLEIGELLMVGEVELKRRISQLFSKLRSRSDLAQGVTS